MKYNININKETTILTFEPHPKTYKKLINNMKSKKFEAFNVGVSDSGGLAELYDYDYNDGSSHASIYKNVIKDLHHGNPISYFVKVIKIDDFLKNKKINYVDLLKIDVGGNEYKVLLGAKSYI